MNPPTTPVTIPPNSPFDNPDLGSALSIAAGDVCLVRSESFFGVDTAVVLGAVKACCGTTILLLNEHRQ